jgi:hypothetical protein
MSLFRKSDELFELMSKQTEALERPSPSPSSGFGRRSIESSAGFGRSADISWRGRRNPSDEWVLVDGDALIVVDDGWELPTGEGAGHTLPIRMDTLVVGAFVATGLLIGAFLYGRTSTDAPPSGQAVAQAVAEEASEEEAVDEPNPEPSVAASNQRGAPSSVAGGHQRGAKPTTVAASAPKPKQAAKKSYELLVCSTSKANAKKLVSWLKDNARSPIFGRADLKPYAKGGSVRIKGFGEREKKTLRQVRRTHDPLGGSGTFGDALYRQR